MHLNVLSNHNTPLRVSLHISQEVAQLVIRVLSQCFFFYCVWVIYQRSE